jgi:alkylhydroperoxidase family enzyme
MIWQNTHARSSTHTVWRDDRSVTTPRIPPVADPSEDVIELYERGGLRAPDGSTLNIFSTLANHPALLRRWLVFASHVLAKNSLTARDRELAILRVGVVCDSKYEFAQHHVIAQRSDITLAEIEQVRVGASHPNWTPLESALLASVDELHRDSRIGDATWAALSSGYSTEQLLDIVFTVGNYHLVSFALNSLGVELDDGIPDTL